MKQHMVRCVTFLGNLDFSLLLLGNSYLIDIDDNLFAFSSCLLLLLLLFRF